MRRPSKSATRLRYDDDTRYQTLAIVQFIELIAFVFTNGLKYRNKYEIVATPCFCLPTGLRILARLSPRQLRITSYQLDVNTFS